MGFQIAKGIFPFLVLIILQAIQPVSQKCNNFSVTIIVFPLDSTLRQWEAAGLRMNIAAYQQGKQGWMGKILQRLFFPESQDSNLHKGHGQCYSLHTPAIFIA